MGWVKFDDGFPQHRKVEPLSDGAFRLIVSAACWSADQLTDGVIPAWKLRALVPRFRASYVDELIDAGLFHCHGHACPSRCPDVDQGDYVVHDYLEWNRSAVDEQARRRKERDKKAAQRARGAGSVTNGRAGRFESRGESRGESLGDRGGESRGESPATRPVPSRRANNSSSSSPVVAPAEPEEEDELDPRIRDAAYVLAERVLAARQAPTPVANRFVWLETTAAERYARHCLAGAKLLDESPLLTPAELADLLEPDLAPPVAPRPRHAGDCAGGCAGTEWLETDSGLVRCPA